MQDNALPKSSILPLHGYTSLYLSLFLLLVSIGSSLGLYAYTHYLTRQIQAEELVRADTEKEISEIAQDRDIVIRKIVTANVLRPSLDLATLVSQFRDAATQANVRLKGFSVNNDTITTSLTATE